MTEPKVLTLMEQAEVARMIEAYSLMEPDDLALAALQVISDLFDGKPADLRFNALAAVYALFTEGA